MAHRRFAYLLALAGALLFQIVNENYLAHFLLVLCVALPLLSLALSLPGMLGCRLALSADPTALDRGSKGRWLVCVEPSNALPLSQLTIRLVGEDLLTGQREHRRLVLSGVARRRPVELEASTLHCGLLELRVRKAKVCDYLGLFSLPVPRPPPPPRRGRPHPARGGRAPRPGEGYPPRPRPAHLLCLPIPAEVELPALPEEGSAPPDSVRAARLGPGDDYDLRAYRPGDPMRSVHWKLSSKWDELIVREQVQATAPVPLLALDRFGPPEVLDRLLDRLLGLSRALLDRQRPHAVLWLDGTGRPQLRAVSDERQLADCLWALMDAPAPLHGPSLKDRPELLRGPDGPAFPIHVALEGGAHD